MKQAKRVVVGSHNARENMPRVGVRFRNKARPMGWSWVRVDNSARLRA